MIEATGMQEDLEPPQGFANFLDPGPAFGRQLQRRFRRMGNRRGGPRGGTNCLRLLIELTSCQNQTNRVAAFT